MPNEITSAEILVVGTELTTGSTRDTNSGDLARDLTALGVSVLGTAALPDDLGRVRAAFVDSLARADLVVSTGGLGPTPDDLTREAIAAACGLEPRVDADLERSLSALFGRRGMVMPDANLKQAWLVDGAQALPNANGTAPGWWVERPDGRLIIALPGPPREMRPMWLEHALPRLQAGRLGVAHASRTLRLTGVGESSVVGLIGEEVLRAANPVVATYARADAVDVVVSAVGDGSRTPAEIVDEAIATLRERVGQFVFAEGEHGWREALADRLGGRTLATAEIGTGGQLAGLLGAASFVVHCELMTRDHDLADLGDLARRARSEHGADIGLAVVAAGRRTDTRVRIAIATESGVEEHERTAFLGGDEGRRRAAIATCAVLWQALGSPG